MSTNDGGPRPLTFADVMGEQRDHMEEVNRLRKEELRDHFAGLAMQGLLSNSVNGSAAAKRIAEWAFEQADAMLAAREQGT